MYVNVSSKEQFYAPGDVFYTKRKKSLLVFGDVRHHRNSDSLAIYWPPPIPLTDPLDLIPNDALDDKILSKANIIDQNFSLGEIAYDERRNLYGEVVNKELLICALIPNSKYVIPNIPKKLLRPQVTLKGFILLDGWIGQTEKKEWSVKFKKGRDEKRKTVSSSTKKWFYYCPFPKTILSDTSGNYTMTHFKLSYVRVKWFHKLTCSENVSSVPPPRRITSKSILSRIVECDMKQYEESILQTLCHYTIREEDPFIPLRNWKKNVIKLMEESLLSPNGTMNQSDEPPPAKKMKIVPPFAVGENVLVNVLRVFNVLDVEWKHSDGSVKLEKVFSKDVRHESRTLSPTINTFRSFVAFQQFTDFAEKSEKHLGVTSRRNPYDGTIFVQWLNKIGDPCRESTTEESGLNLIPHERFGKMRIGSYVEKSRTCKENGFIFGIITNISTDGNVTVACDAAGNILRKMSPEDLRLIPDFNAALDANKSSALSVPKNLPVLSPPKIEIALFPNYFFQAVIRDAELLNGDNARKSGIAARPIFDRPDLWSGIIIGTEDTPYESGIFIFEIRLPNNYPNDPPTVKFIMPLFKNPISFHLTNDGPVVLQHEYRMKPFPSPFAWRKNYTMLDVLEGIKRFVFVKEPFIHWYPGWNEGMTSFDVERIKAYRVDSLRQFNSIILVEIVDSFINILESGTRYDDWKNKISEHLITHLPRLIQRLKLWIDAPKLEALSRGTHPNFTLFPISKGVKVAIQSRLDYLKKHLFNPK